MLKPSKKVLGYLLIAIISLSSGLYVGRVYSNGSNPTVDEFLGIFNFLWGNFTQGVNAPEYYRNDENYTEVIETISDENLLQDGSEGLTGDWDTGNFGVSAKWFNSSSYYINDINRSIALLAERFTGATAYIGFNDSLSYMENYFVCDGVSDDVEIQAALDYVAALGGAAGKVYLDEGTYNIAGQITGSTSILLEGAGIDITILVATADVHMLVFDTVGQNYIIRDMTVDGDRSGSGQITGNGIYIKAGSSFIDNVKVIDTAGSGIACVHFDNTLPIFSVSNSIFDFTGTPDGFGPAIRVSTGGGIGVVEFVILTDNKITRGREHGIKIYEDAATYSIIKNNLVDGSAGTGIYLGGMGIIEGNTVINNGDGHAIALAWNYIVCIKNIIRHSYARAISSEGNYNKIELNDAYNSGIGGTLDGIVSTGDHCIISKNTVNGTTQYGLLVSGNYNKIFLNIVVNTTSRGMYFTGLSYSEIDGNTIDVSANSMSFYGTSQYNRIGYNRMVQTTIWPEPDATNILPTLTLSFVEGTTFMSTAPFGWEIDLEGEYAIALGHMPDDVQQVISWTIWATSSVTNSTGMKLEIEGYGGASGEPYSTATISVTNYSSITGVTADKITYWYLDKNSDDDLDDFLGGDAIMIKILYEIADSFFSETDAIFLCIDIRYL